MPQKFNFSFQKLVALIIGCVLIGILSITVYSYKNNFHTIIPGEFYRSAQPDSETLKRLVAKYHIRSIINLRGDNPNKKWYQEEIQTSRLLNVQHYDVKLRSSKMPTGDQIRKLVTYLDLAPKPILIHCRMGADRTGLASAFAILLDNNSLDKAKDQISMKYFVTSRLSIGKQVLPHYQQWLEKKGLSSSKENFLQWVNQIDTDRMNTGK